MVSDQPTTLVETQRSHKPVACTSELALYEEGLLPNGVLASRMTYCDQYVGIKDDLIAAGYADARWFPDRFIEGKRKGTIKRSFRIAIDTGNVKLLDLKNGHWQLRLPISQEREKARRDEYYLEKEQRRREAAEREELRRQEIMRSLRLANLVTPGSLSNAELHHVRILRTLAEEERYVVMESAEQFLRMSDVCHGSDAQPRPRLRLVVDNEGKEPRPT